MRKFLIGASAALALTAGAASADCSTYGISAESPADMLMPDVIAAGPLSEHLTVPVALVVDPMADVFDGRTDLAYVSDALKLRADIIAYGPEATFDGLPGDPEVALLEPAVTVNVPTGLAAAYVPPTVDLLTFGVANPLDPVVSALGDISGAPAVIPDRFPLI